MVDDEVVNAVRLQVLDSTTQTGVVPHAAAVAGALGRTQVEVESAFRQLGEAHV